MKSGESGKVILTWHEADADRSVAHVRRRSSSTWPVQLDEIREGRALQGRARAAHARRSAHVGVTGQADVLNHVREQLPRAGQSSRGRQGGARGARPLGQRAGLGPLHLRHAGAPQGARAALERVPRHGGHDPLLLVLGRQRRPVRDDPRRRGRGHLRRAQPRLDHRRHSVVQGAALPLPERRHGRPRSNPDPSQRSPCDPASRASGRSAAAASRTRSL